MQLHIIYTEIDMLLSKRQYASWREIQNEYQNYTTSLGPWSDLEVIEYLTDEYPKIWPSAQEQVRSFLSGTQDVQAIAFLKN